MLVFGSIGEFYAFPLDVKKQAVDFVAKHVAGRIKVFAGVGDTNLNNVIDFARQSKQVEWIARGRFAVSLRPYCGRREGRTSARSLKRRIFR